MQKEAQQQSVDIEIRRLETLLEELVKTCEQLRNENSTLRTQSENLAGEHSELLEKNELARSRVEAMIAHLKSMEQGS